MAEVEEPVPLVLCMENASGQEVALNIAPTDDFQTFLNKAKDLLGFEVDINSITQNRPVSLNQNIYQFLINAEQHQLNPVEPIPATEAYQPLLTLNDTVNNDVIYILDDGTQVKASQIQFDSEETPIDLNADTIPFVKYNNEIPDVIIPNEFKSPDETKKINILESPVSGGKASVKSSASSKSSFINSLPFKPVPTVDVDFETEFETFIVNKNIDTTEGVNSQNLSNKEALKSYSFAKSDKLNTPNRLDDFSTMTREQILNMLKDSPVKAVPYSDRDANASDKPKHRRKTDPSRPVIKKFDATIPKSFIDVDVIKSNTNNSCQNNCYMCNLFVNNDIDKIYIFDKEDQNFYRTSPLKQPSSPLRIICEGCLDKRFKLCTELLSDKRLNDNEYLIIRNRQQYVYKILHQSQTKDSLKSEQTSKNGDAKAIIDKIESKIFKHTTKDKIEFVKVEISSDGEYTTKSIDGTKLDARNDLDKEDAKSSDIDNLEGETSDVELLDDSAEEAHKFVGDEKNNDMSCRFCGEVFDTLPDATDHAKEHYLEDEDVYPCTLCEYGYQTLPWLRGHMRTKHGAQKYRINFVRESNNAARTPTPERGSDSACGSPVAARTRSTAGQDRDNSAGINRDKSVKVKTAKKTETKEDSPESVILDTSQSTDKLFTLLQQGIVKDDDSPSDGEGIWILDTTDDDPPNSIKKTKKKTHQCGECKKYFSTPDSRKRHKCKKKSDKITQESQDDDDILYMPSKEDFLRRAEGRKMDEYLDDEGFIRPMKYRPRKCKVITSDPNMVSCHNCDASFTSKVRLKFHIQFHESNNDMQTSDGRYKCSTCTVERAFDTETELFDHVHFTHNNRKRWICPVQGCGKTFFLRATLTKHSRTHTDTRRYACVTCHKRFLDKQTLDEHSVTHLKIKPFQCHICLKHLTRRSRLRMHLRAHEEELAPRLVRVCRMCDRAFKDTTEAQEHAQMSQECVTGRMEEIQKETDGIEDKPLTRLSPTSGLVTTEPVNLDLDSCDKSGQRRRLLKHMFEPEDAESAQLMLDEMDEETSLLIKIVEIEKAFRCEFCEDVFYLEDALNAHRSIHRDVKNPFTCHICKVSFPTYSRCTTHKTTHGFYKRSLAEVQKQGEEEDHTEDGVKREPAGPSANGIVGYGGFPVVKHFLCEDCGRSYLHWTYLQVHRRMKHTKDNCVHQCGKCGSTFPNSWSAAYHRRKFHNKSGEHDEKEPAKKYESSVKYACRDCEQLLPNKSALYKHRRKMHTDGQRAINKQGRGLFSCAQCGKRYASKPGLEAHFRSHANADLHNAPYACAKCGKTFTLATDLTQHVKLVHGRELDHTCMDCSKTFCSRAELSVHSRTHSLHRPHLCAVCGHAFRTVSMRNEHLRIHTGERPYPCDVCGVAFRRSTAMRNHRLIHTGVRAFPCPRCPKRFRIRSDLRTHLRLKHPEQILVLEMAGLSPTPEEVRRQLRLNNIPPEKVLDIAKISLPKGTLNTVPMSECELNKLVSLQRQDEESACWSERVLAELGSRQSASVHFDNVLTQEQQYQECFQASRRGRGIARNPRRTPLRTLQLNGQTQFNDNGPVYFNGQPQINENGEIYFETQPQVNDNGQVYFNGQTQINENGQIYFDGQTQINENGQIYLNGQPQVNENGQIYFNGPTTLNETQLQMQEFSGEMEELTGQAQYGQIQECDGQTQYVLGTEQVEIKVQETEPCSVVMKDVTAEELTELLGGGYLTADGRGVLLNSGQYVEFDPAVLQQMHVDEQPYTLQTL